MLRLLGVASGSDCESLNDNDLLIAFLGVAGDWDWGGGWLAVGLRGIRSRKGEPGLGGGLALLFHDGTLSSDVGELWFVDL